MFMDREPAARAVAREHDCLALIVRHIHDTDLKFCLDGVSEDCHIAEELDVAVG